jgi:IS30 family transposase
LEERLQIADLRLAGASMRAISIQLGRAPSTISRELARNGPAPAPAAARSSRARYAPYAAHKRAGLRARRPKPFRLDDPRLALAVQTKLCLKWSPQQISLHLAGEHGDEAMQVSHETIYQALFVQGRGQLRSELHRHLRTGRAWRRPRGLSGANKSKIPGMVSISERPAEAEDRAVPDRAATALLTRTLISVNFCGRTRQLSSRPRKWRRLTGRRPRHISGRLSVNKAGDSHCQRRTTSRGIAD